MKFICKKEGCNKAVYYCQKSQNIEITKSVSNDDDVFPVYAYLTCEEGHTYPYQINQHNITVTDASNDIGIAFAIEDTDGIGIAALRKETNLADLLKDVINSKKNH